MFMAASNPALRSTLNSFRKSAITKMAAAKPNKPSIPSSSSPFQLPKLKPLSQRILLRSPVELSSCVDSLMPYHTATSSALLNSLISVTRNSCWLPEGLDKTT